MSLPPLTRLLALQCALGFASLNALTLSILDRGARANDEGLDTAAINTAIAEVSQAGGGTVLFPAGTYRSHSLRLRSHVELRFEAGAVLVAAPAPSQAGEAGYDPAEPNPWSEYQDFGHSHFHNSLIWGEGLENVSITGPGLIYGEGLSRGNGRASLPVGQFYAYPVGTESPDVLNADGPVSFVPRPDLKPGPFNYPNARDALPDGVGNKAIALKNCRGVLLRDFTILHGGHFALLATGVDNLTIDNLLIDTNRDGMDIDACSNVRISNCSVNSPWDDGICLKASYALGVARPCENVTITNCLVSGFNEGTLHDGRRLREPSRYHGGPMGRIKLGTEASGGFRNIAISNCVFEHCRGLALESVDGAPMEDIVVSNLTMRDIFNAPLFVRLGGRLRTPGNPGASGARRIRIDGLNATVISPEHGILVLGLPGRPVRDLSLSGVNVEFPGGGTLVDARRAYPELEKGYPEPNKFGRTTAWGLLARHVSGLRIHDVRLTTRNIDERPISRFDEVAGLEVSNSSVTLPDTDKRTSR